jgi:hypothetical protein
LDHYLLLAKAVSSTQVAIVVLFVVGMSADTYQLPPEFCTTRHMVDILHYCKRATSVTEDETNSYS